MISANELRIGNLVKASVFGGKPGEQEWIHITGKVDALHKDYINLGDGVRFEYKHISGIPISEEILLKCGFEKCQLDRYSYLELKVNNTKFITDDKGKVLVGVYGPAQYEYLLLTIEYIHQLQNLYFSLTGQELEINL